MNKKFLLVLALAPACLGMAPRPDPTSTTQPAPYANPVNPGTEITLANKFFKGKILIPEAIYPTRALGAFIVLDKDNAVKTITRVLPDKPFPEPEILNDTVFEAIVDKSFAGSVSYLSFVNAEISGADKAAVSLKAVFRAKGPEFFSSEVQAAYDQRLKQLPLEPTDRVFYTEAIQLLLASSSVLSSDSAKASGAFVVQAGGQTYYSNSRTQSQRILVAEGVEIKIQSIRVATDPVGNKINSIELAGADKAFKQDFEAVVTKSTLRLK